MELRNEKGRAVYHTASCDGRKAASSGKGSPETRFPVRRKEDHVDLSWAFPALHGSKSRNRRNDRGRTHDDRILCAMGFVFGTYALLKGWLDAKKQIISSSRRGGWEDNYQWNDRFYEDGI